MKRFSSFLIVPFFCATLASRLAGAEPYYFYGLPLTPFGDAELSHPTNSYEPNISHIGSNGMDGVTITTGDADNGVYFYPNAYVEDGGRMFARAFGRLVGDTNEQFLCSIQGGRAAAKLYPLRVDFSPLGSSSFTCQIYDRGNFVGEVHNEAPLISADYYPGPRANPFVRRPDGSVGALLEFGGPVMVSFVDSLISFGGDEVFLRVNNPTNAVSVITKVDVHGAGALHSFVFYDLRLGMFGRAHKLLENGKIAAVEGKLRIQAETNAQSGVAVELERLAGIDFNIEADLSRTNAYVAVEGIGCSGGTLGTTLGLMRINNTGTNLHLERFVPEVPDPAPYTTNMVIAFLNSNVVVLETNLPVEQVRLFAPLAARLKSVSAKAKTVQTLAGLGVRFDAPSTFDLNGSAIIAEEVHYLMTEPFVFEFLETGVITTREVPLLTILSETPMPTVGPPALHIARTGTNVIVSWPDPNLLYSLEMTDIPLHIHSWRLETYAIGYSNRHSYINTPSTSKPSEFWRLSFGRRGRD